MISKKLICAASPSLSLSLSVYDLFIFYDILLMASSIWFWQKPFLFRSESVWKVNLFLCISVQ